MLHPQRPTTIETVTFHHQDNSSQHLTSDICSCLCIQNVETCAKSYYFHWKQVNFLGFTRVSNNHSYPLEIKHGLLENHPFGSMPSLDAHLVRRFATVGYQPVLHLISLYANDNPLYPLISPSYHNSSQLPITTPTFLLLMAPSFEFSTHGPKSSKSFGRH